MVDAKIGIAECPTPDQFIDNEELTTTVGVVKRQRTISPTADALATEIRDAVQGVLDVNANLGQEVATNTTKVLTAADCSPGSPWVSGWDQTRDRGVVRILTVLATTDPAIGGTFTFEFGEDGSTALISEQRPIGDFVTVRDFDLINAGGYYQVKFEPAAPLGGDSVFVTTTLRRQNDGAFVRLANQEIEEANAAMGQQFAYLKAFNAQTGKSVNLRPDESGALRVADDRFSVSQSGALRTTGIRDDISIHFFDGTHEDVVGGIIDDGSVNGTATFDATEGRAVFAVPATAGSTAIFRSDRSVSYQAGHTIRAEQTIEISAQPTGNGFVEWGVGQNGDTIGWRYDANGLSVIRRKNGVLELDVPMTDWNRDKCDGGVGSQFLFDFAPQVLDPLKNNRYINEYEWLGVAPPTFFVTSPNRKQVEVHVEEYPNQNSGTTVPNPELPIFVHVANDTTSGQVLSVACGSWRGGTNTDEVVLLARQPDLDLVSAKADGTVFTNVTTLGAGASTVFTSALTDSNGWFDSDGWSTIELVIATNQVSGTDGIVIEFTDDVEVVTPVIRASETFTYEAADVARGHISVIRSVKMDGFRIRYVNGGVAQGNFFAQANVRVSPAGPPLNSLEASIGSTSVAQMGRNAIFAKNGSNVYDLIGRGTAGGLDVGVVQHETSTPIKPASSWAVKKVTVTATSAVVLAAGEALTGRVSVEVYNADSTKDIHIGTSTATVTAGQFRTVAPGQGIVLELGGTTEIAAKAAFGSCSVEIVQLADPTLP